MLRDLTTEQVLNADFRLYGGNPVIENFGLSFVVADPSVLTPHESHDGKWHLFCHTFFGVYRLDSEDGVKFGCPKKIVPRAMRPNINRIDGKYYLYYERTLPLLGNALSLVGGKWKSSIYVTESADLVSWTASKEVVGHTRDYEVDERGQAISNPFLLPLEDGYRLYYNAGQTYLDDCKFCEPTHISCACSTRPDGGFAALEKPLLSPDFADPYRNLCCGCIKVYRLKDGYVALQNGIYRRDGKSHSAILAYTSSDGLDFRFRKVLLEPQRCGDNDWMAQYVYACCLTEYEGRLRLYFNARNASAALSGRECIGFCEAKVEG